MLSFNDLQEKKTKIKLNPKKDDVMEGSCGSMPKMAKGGAISVDKLKNNHGDDCGCMKCDKKRRKKILVMKKQYLRRNSLCQSRRSFRRKHKRKQF